MAKTALDLTSEELPSYHLYRISNTQQTAEKIDMEVSGTGFIAFLLSDDASYITATTIHVDGGRVAH